MLQFEHFVARHDEIAVQAIIENLERFEGVRFAGVLSLEERWQRLMQGADQQTLTV